MIQRLLMEQMPIRHHLFNVMKWLQPMYGGAAFVAVSLTVILSFDSAYAAIGFVQGSYATPQSPQSVVSVNYTGAQGAGNLNVVVVGWNDTTAAVSSVTDSRGNVYTLAVGPTQYSNQLSQSIYYARGILSSAAGTNTVTVRFTTTAVYTDIRILEYSGLDQLNPVDVTAAATGTNSSSNSGLATTANANDLIFAANVVSTMTRGPGTGFAKRMITSPNGDIAEDRVVTTVGSYSGIAPLSSAGPWIMQMVAFKAASGGGTPDTSPPTSPSNLLATPNGANSINLTWTASIDNVGVTNYLIERCQGAGCTSFAQGGTAAGTAYSDTGLLSETSYSYRARATDAAGNLSGYSNVSTATTNQSTVGSISFVQLAYATPQAAQLAVPVTFSSSQTAGNLNVVVVGWNDTTAAVTSVTDSVGNVYALAVGPTKNQSSLTQSIYYAKNIVGAAASTNTVTVRFNVAAQYADIRILEYSGLDRVNPVDVTAASIGTNSSSTSTAVTTTNSNDLIVGANTMTTVTAGAGTGFIKRVITEPDGDIAEDRIVSAVGSYSATAPLTSSGQWVMQMVAFRGGATGPPPPPDQVGQWSGPFDWPIVAVHMALLPTGKVLASDGQLLGSDARVWDPATGSLSPVPASDNIFCNGAAGLPDGKILVAGGNDDNGPDGGHSGLRDTNIFDPFSQTWLSAPSMSFPRWYPTVTTLPDGRMLVTSGETTCDGCIASIPEVYNPTTNSWSQLTAASLNVPYYPHMFVLPDGRVLNSSTAEAPVPTRVLNVQTQSVTIVDSSTPDGGSAVMYRPGKILKTGTSVNPDLAVRPSASTAYVLDMTQASPAWTQVPSMNFARTYHTMVMLPDGNVLVTNGGQTTDAVGVGTAVLEPEMWSPSTQAFTKLASMVSPRLYHSTALLLPDARVLVTGGGRFIGVNEPTNQLSAEIYSPPYLFKGSRPIIGSAPSTVNYATNFSVMTPDAAQISAVALIRLGAVTHAFDQNQRYVPLTFQQVAGALTVQAPGTANLAPPGYYMLFILNNNGVPSVASMVKIQ